MYNRFVRYFKMFNERGLYLLNVFSWLKIFDPKLTFSLIIIIIYLFLVALGNMLSVYNTIVSQDYSNLLNQILSVVLYLVPAYGLLKLKNWARLAEIAISGFAVILGFLLMLIESLGAGAFIIVTHCLIAIYLLKTESKNIYKSKQKAG